ncbi:MAG: family 20 glycosylhydrolase [Rikenellaceae bacterium]
MRRFFALLLLALISTIQTQAQDNLLPKPQSVEWGKGYVNLTQIKIVNNSDIDFIEKEAKGLGFTISDKASKSLKITLVDDIEEAKVNKNEAYRLNVTSTGVEIEATEQSGVYLAFQTLRQLLDIKNGVIKAQKCQISDYPAFRVRGLMQDVGRSYVSVEELKREIKKLSEYKINVFHFHLTENQSWRLESKIFPMINDSINTTRMPGKFYTIEQAKELVEFCKEHNVMLIPEIDMPGHSAAFVRTFRHDMQSVEGMKILKLLIDEVCETFDVPYLHIGTDEVRITNPTFVSEMVAFIRERGKKVISWNPGSNYEVGEIDMIQMWSSFGRSKEGIPAIDSRYHYLNHFDAFADIIALYNSRIANVEIGSDDIAGSIMAIWHDRLVEPEEDMMIQNALYPTMLAFAERTWLGGGSEYYNDKGTQLDTTKTVEFLEFADFERRMLHHKKTNFEGYPFAYVKQTNIEWAIIEAFPNGGDLTKSFPPEDELKSSYEYEGKEYKAKKAIGAGFYLRHVWGDFIPSFHKKAEPNHTAYAYTWVYSPKDQECGMWITFQNYSRSEMDLSPPQGKWDIKESNIWLNDQEIAPPVWSETHTVKSNEVPLGNVNFETREPTKVHLNKGWNKLFVKLPVGEFTHPSVRLLKWMFTAVFVTMDGTDSVDGLIYSPYKKK